MINREMLTGKETIVWPRCKLQWLRLKLGIGIFNDKSRETDNLEAIAAMMINSSLQLTSKRLQSTHHNIEYKMTVFALAHHLRDFFLSIYHSIKQ